MDEIILCDTFLYNLVKYDECASCVDMSSKGVDSYHKDYKCDALFFYLCGTLYFCDLVMIPSWEWSSVKRK